MPKVAGIFAAGRVQCEAALKRQSIIEVLFRLAPGGGRKMADGNTVTGPIVWIRDCDGPVSVTNDAEGVCQRVNRAYPGYRIVYQDSMGMWDELVHTNGKFEGFKSARHLDPDSLRNN